MAAAFVGRARELDSLTRLSGRGVDRPVVGLLMWGDPGAGKSRLLDEFASGADSGMCLRLAGHESEATVPLAGVATLLRALVDPDEGAALQRLLVDGGDALSLDPLRVFEAAHRALRRRGPTTLLVDDAQWVDVMSLALLHYVARAAADAGDRLILIVASRPSAQTDSFARSLAHALPLGATTVLELGGLNQVDGVALARELRPDLSPFEAEELWRRTGGMPFWLETLARHGGPTADPAQLLQTRLLGLDGDAARLLALLAVAGRPFPVSDAAELLEWAPARAVPAERALAGAGLTVSAGGALRPAHDLIREAALTTLPTETRVRLHRRLAEWLEGQGGDDLQLLLEAIHHRHAGGLPSLAPALRVARSPRRRLLGETGLRQLEEIADDAGITPSTLALHEAVASLAAELAEDRRALDRWLLVSDALPNPMARARALLAASEAAVELEDEHEARALLARAEACTSDVTVAIELSTLRALIALRLGSGTEAAASRFAEEAAKRARALAATGGGVEALDAVSLLAYERAMRVRAEAAYNEVNGDAEVRAAEDRVAAARLLGEEEYLSAALTLATARWSIEGMRQVRDEAVRRVLPVIAFDAGVHLVALLLGAGRLPEAESAAAEAQKLAGRVPDLTRHRCSFPYYRCILDLYCGDIDEGLRGLERVAALERLPARRANFQLERAHWCARARGEALADEALASLAAARDCLGSTELPVTRGIARLVEAEVLARIGQVDGARTALADWDTHSVPSQPWEPLRRRAVGALLAFRAGDRASAADELERVRAGFESKGLALEAVWTRIDVGRALAETDRPRAAGALRTAASEATALGATTLRQLAEQALRATGVRTWRRTPAVPGQNAGLGSLTAREREVAALVADGASNPEIAQRLYLSRKTVERHVSNALLKAGARNRAELAAKIVEARSAPSTANAPS